MESRKITLIAILSFLIFTSGKAQGDACKFSICDSTQMEKLYLYESRWTIQPKFYCDTNLMCLSDHKKLKHISYDGNRFNERFLKFKSDRIESIEIEFDGNSLCNLNFENFPKLSILEVFYPKADLNKSCHLLNLDSLTSLNLYFNKIKGTPLNNIIELKSLKRLYLKGYKKVNFPNTKANITSSITEIFIGSSHFPSKRSIKNLDKIKGLTVYVYWDNKVPNRVKYFKNNPIIILSSDGKKR